VIAPAAYNYAKRIPIPEPPADYDECVEHLKYRCFEFVSLNGEFEISDQAYDIQYKWYMTRPPENDVALEAAWHRDDDLCWKLAMILSLADNIDMVIEGKHVVAAQKLVGRAHKDLPKLMSAASQTENTEIVDMMRDEVRKAGRITHRSLLQRLAAKGKKATEVHEAARALKQMGELDFKTGPKGGVIYEWRG
jgi:hypothetical protein